MTRHLWTVFVLLILATGPLVAQEIVWQQDVESASALAADADRPVLLLATAGVWCDPCGWIERNTLTDRQVRRLVQQSFVPLRIDDGLGRVPGVEIERLPTFAVLSADGSLIARLDGAVSATALQSFLDEALARLSSAQQRTAEQPVVTPEPQVSQTVTYRYGEGTIVRENGLWRTRNTPLPALLEEYDRDAAFVYLRDPEGTGLWAITVAEGRQPRLWQWDRGISAWVERSVLSVAGE